ncbi:unnamed protein product, partial [Symbiodinium sp. KB8]
MWVTEIACSDPHSPERLSAEAGAFRCCGGGNAIPLLEADEDVEMYAWFSYFKDQWAHPIAALNGDAGLVHPNGTLTNLGRKLFETFAAGSNLTEINITAPEWKKLGHQIWSGRHNERDKRDELNYDNRKIGDVVEHPHRVDHDRDKLVDSGRLDCPSCVELLSEWPVSDQKLGLKLKAASVQTPAKQALHSPVTWQDTVGHSDNDLAVEAPITTVAQANTTTEHAHTNYTSSRHLTGTAPSTTMTQGGESTTYTLDEEARECVGLVMEADRDNTTNDTELTCGEAVEAWCQSDPEDWRLHDAMCTSPVGGGQAAPQFSAGTTLQEGSPLSVLFLIMAVIGAAMASAALTSAFHRQRCLWLRFLCCCQKRREDEDSGGKAFRKDAGEILSVLQKEQEDLKRAVSEKDWPGRCLNVMGPLTSTWAGTKAKNRRKNASVAPAPESGVLLPVE